MKNVLIVLSLVLLSFLPAEAKSDRQAAKDMKLWVAAVEKICSPVLENLSCATLKQNMPVETNNKNPQSHRTWAHLEAFGRTLTGIGPWLELGPDDSKEGVLRERFIRMTLEALDNAVDPDSPDFHLDYYNSFVIHPMLTQVLEIAARHIPEWRVNSRGSSDAIPDMPGSRKG